MWKSFWTAVAGIIIKIALFFMIRKAGKDAEKREQAHRTLSNAEKAKKAREAHEEDPETIRRKWGRE